VTLRRRVIVSDALERNAAVLVIDALVFRTAFTVLMFAVNPEMF